MTRCYRRAVTIVDAEQLGGVMLGKLTELFDEERTSQTRVKSRRAAQSAQRRQAKRIPAAANSNIGEE